MSPTPALGSLLPGCHSTRLLLSCPHTPHQTGPALHIQQAGAGRVVCRWSEGKGHSSCHSCPTNATNACKVVTAGGRGIPPAPSPPPPHSTLVTSLTGEQTCTGYGLALCMTQLAEEWSLCERTDCPESAYQQDFSCCCYLPYPACVT